MSKQIKIRKATENDFSDWTHMRLKLWPHASFDELKELEHLRQTNGFACYFAEVDDKLVRRRVK